MFLFKNFVRWGPAIFLLGLIEPLLPYDPSLLIEYCLDKVPDKGMLRLWYLALGKHDPSRIYKKSLVYPSNSAIVDTIYAKPT